MRASFRLAPNAVAAVLAAIALPFAPLACTQKEAAAPHKTHVASSGPDTPDPVFLALDVKVLADPPPPFIYWAPKGTTVINHANPGIWVAQDGGKTVALYFGDACGASHLQTSVGKPMAELPRLRAAGGVRKFCSTCPHNDDLKPDRLNIEFDESTQTVAKIACY